MWCVEQTLDLITILTLVCQLPLTRASVVEVMYPKKEIKLIEGSSIKLNCTAVYQPKNCTTLSVYWCRRLETNPCQSLSEPDRQLITMNETADPQNNIRYRDVMLEMWNISAKDAGLFQCQANCANSSANGHFITLNIDRTSAGSTPKPANCCGSKQTDLIVLLVATVATLFLWLECQSVP
ncbi:uncharacterized protein zgc:174945 [Sardina pilchardus]|uniref:uncharacterized protein zgc:174945 n=1 Tax=Sardina pilchardus TaxID=27697 RepID=UPI002E115E8B